MTDDYLRDRLEAVRGQLAAVGAQAILIGSEFNRRWLSGFGGSSGWLLVTQDRALLGTDFRYWVQARAQAPHFDLFQLSGDRTKKDLVRAVAMKDIVFESQHISVAEFQSLQEVEGVNWLPRQGLVEELRATKDQAELTAIRHAAKITDGIMNRVAEIATTGMTEAELAWELESAMRVGGAAGMTFPVIVASGPNAALPHHVPGDRRLQRGDILLVDMGASYAGYGSDLTRTFFLGETPDRHFVERYDVVARAHEAAIQGLGPDVTGQEVDRVARNLIAGAGYGEQFGHGLGHGVGLEGHEAPRLSTTASDAPLAPGMVATVEPGIYFPGWGGIRIEDLVLITASGHEVISQCPKEPLISP